MHQVRAGMALVFVSYAAQGSPLYGLEADAKSQHRGLWADRQATVPWDWRRDVRPSATLALKEHTNMTPRFDINARPIYRNGGEWGQGTADYSHAFSGWTVQAAWSNEDGSYTVIRNADGSNDPSHAVKGVVRPRADGTIDDSAGWARYEVGFDR
jgi:hypothetical protein